ncbi:hypothetical protein [Lysinibacillus sp. RC79]|uniref:hypothetical protein n=1 Tax=Lysinibacillus sp. RC79 TaxID=3156296 RepID=UPI0035132918
MIKSIFSCPFVGSNLKEVLFIYISSYSHAEYDWGTEHFWYLWYPKIYGQVVYIEADNFSLKN